MPSRQPSMRSDLQDVLITVARIDERMVTMFNRQESTEERVNSMDEKIVVHNIRNFTNFSRFRIPRNARFSF